MLKFKSLLEMNQLLTSLWICGFQENYGTYQQYNIFEKIPTSLGNLGDKIKI